MQQLRVTVSRRSAPNGGPNTVPATVQRIADSLGGSAYPTLRLCGFLNYYEEWIIARPTDMSDADKKEAETALYQALGYQYDGVGVRLVTT